MNKLDAFKELANIFKRNGFTLYLVGGAVRDYLLKGDFSDIDVTSDARPDEIKKMGIADCDYTFEKYGNVNIHYVGYKFELTTLRKEDDYTDKRHPHQIFFAKDIKEDYSRRDFTINALYMDESLNIYDFVNGREDLKKKLIRVIGDSNKRINEDPLRIIRAIRFAIDLDFEIEDELQKTIVSNLSLLDSLNKDKIRQELRKIKTNKNDLKSYFDKFGISKYLDMIN